LSTHRLGIIVTKKLKLGYRAGRLIDQLEAAGIVGPFEEVKHVVYILDMSALDQFLTMNKIINTMKHFILITFILLLAFRHKHKIKGKSPLDQVTTKVSYDNIVIDFKYSLNNAKENINQDSKGNVTMKKSICLKFYGNHQNF
jgi:hypothetical protein